MAERLNARDSKSCIRGDSYRGFKSLLIRHLQHRLDGGVFFRRLSCFKRRLGLLSTDGIMAWASNAVAGAAAFLRRKMFPRACRQNQPEHRLVLLSASPHPPFTAPS